MGKKLKKYYNLGLSLAMGIGVLTFSNFTYATDDNIGFSFELKPNYGNSYSESRYRQTTDPNNKWKVNLTYSSEGVGSSLLSG
nr:DUF2712 domain-containing protein [Anoxybacillus flavithermus]